MWKEGKRNCAVFLVLNSFLLLIVAWRLKGLQLLDIQWYQALGYHSPSYQLHFPQKTLVSTSLSAISSGTPFFSAVMLPVDAAKTSEKALWELLLLEAAFTSGWISTRIFEVSEEEHVSGVQLPSGMTPELHRAPSPSAELGQRGRVAGGSALQSVLTSFCSFWGIFLYFIFFSFFFFPLISCKEGNIWECTDLPFILISFPVERTESCGHISIQ